LARAMIINLSDEWKERARSVGRARYAYARAAGIQQNGPNDKGAEPDIKGAIAEASAAKYFGIPWKAHIGKLNEPDVGDYDVRARRVPGTGTDLPIKPHDIDDRPYILAHIFEDDSVDLRGWIYGREGKAGVWCELYKIWFVKPPYRAIETLLGKTPEVKP
jgi:hypothetical protein